MEHIGITLSITSLFAASLDVLDRISAAKSYRKDFRIFVAKVETERLRLFLWGQAVGLTRERDGESSQQHELLRDPIIREKVCELLTWAIQLFEDSDTVRKRYSTSSSITIESPTRALVAFTPGPDSATGTTNQASPETVAASNNPRRRAGFHLTNTLTTLKIKWALSGKRKSEKLLQDLGWFINTLRELVPPRVSEQLSSSPPTASLILRLTAQLLAEYRSSWRESRIRRTQKHARQIAVSTDKKVHKILGEER
jgi:hypothetical protein